MWLLIFILSASGAPELGAIMTVLSTYPTLQKCQSERLRITDEMITAYPLDHDFDLVCRLNSPRHKAATQPKEESLTD